MHKRIQWRMIIIFTGIVLIGGMAQLLIAGNQLAHATLSFYRHDLEKDVLVIANVLSEPFEHFLEHEATLSDLINPIIAFGQDGAYDYILTDNKRRVLASSSPDITPLDTLQASPEFDIRPIDHVGTHIRADATGIDRLYVASPIIYEQDILGYIILYKPMTEAYEQVAGNWWQLAGITLPILTLVIIASWWVSRSISRPLLQLRNSALQIANGALHTRVHVSTQDEIGELGATLNYMAERLEDLINTQRHFVSHAAHELRTPLMMLKLRAEALQEASLSDTERTTYFHDMTKEIDYMAKLISALLTLARLDEGKRPIASDLSPIDYLSLIHDIARHWRIEADKKGLTMTITLPDQLPALPISDNDLRIVLDNLLENAIKYTHQGTIDFCVQHHPHMVLIRVRDTGIGFAMSQHHLLFTRFYRTEQARIQASGTGLGLSIVKAILTNAHATIEAFSQGEGMGATFTVTFVY